MWTAIGYISGGTTLVAFIVAVAASVYRQKMLQKQKLILTAAEDQRHPLVLAALEFFKVDTGNLTKKQQFDLAIEQIKARATRFLVSAVIVALISVLGAALTAYAISLTRATTSDSNANTIILDKHARNLLLSELSEADSAPVIRQQAMDQLEPYAGQDFSGCNFDGLDLSGRDFSKAVFRNVSFVKADLTDAVFQEATFQGANLVQAILRGADLSDADMSRARISEADLEGANLTRTSLVNVEIGEVKDIERIDGTPVTVLRRPAILRGAVLTGTDFKDAHCTGVDLRGLDLSKSRNLVTEQIQDAIVDAKTQLPTGVAAPDQIP